MYKAMTKQEWREQGSGTGRVDSLPADTDRDELVAAFGEPTLGIGDDLDKTEEEWWILFDDGTVASIYAYRGCTPYSIGGHGPRSAQRVAEALGV